MPSSNRSHKDNHHHHHHHHEPSSSPQRTSTRKSKRVGARPQRQKSNYSNKAATWLEPRILMITTGVTLLGAFLQIIAISTDSWLILDAPDGIYRNASGKYLVGAHTGLWRLCRVEVERQWKEGKLHEETHESCEAHNLFPSEEELRVKQDYDRHHLDYTRTAIAFTIIALVIMMIGHAFAFYALKRPRYIIKRLAALLHFMTAACLLVLNEVFIKTVEHEKKNMPGRIPAQAETHYGYSFVLSWLVFVFFVLAGLIFLFSSHKRKAEYADSNDALEDEPMEIFRR